MFARLQKFFVSKPNSQNITLLEIFKPLYVLLSVLGLFPYNVKFKTKHSCVIIPRSIYKTSLYGTSINLLLFIFLFIHIRGIIMLTDCNSLTDAIMTQINYILELINLTIFCIVAYTCAIMNRYNFVNILNTLAAAWMELPSKNNNILINLKYNVFKTLLCLVLLAIVQIAVNYTRHDSLWKKILVTFTFNLPQMIQFIVLAFYYVLIVMVLALLKKIQDKLRSSMIDRTTSIECFIQMETRLPISKLRTMEMVFVKAFEVKRSLNEAFQAPILVAAVQCFHAMVSEAHIIIHGAIIQRILTTHEVINCSIWIIYQLLKMYVLAHSGNLLKIETYQLGQALHNIPIEKHDLRTLIEIQHFASLISFQATEMTVYGYFPLDATLMFKIIASATMYLIILVQFDKKS